MKKPRYWGSSVSSVVGIHCAHWADIRPHQAPMQTQQGYKAGWQVQIRTGWRGRHNPKRRDREWRWWQGIQAIQYWRWEPKQTIQWPTKQRSIAMCMQSEKNESRKYNLDRKSMHKSERCHSTCNRATHQSVSRIRQRSSKLVVVVAAAAGPSDDNPSLRTDHLTHSEPSSPQLG